MYIYRYRSAAGPLWFLEKDGAICGLYLRPNACFDGAQPACTSLIQQAVEQVADYLAGRRYNFSVPILLEGTRFQKKVWQTVAAIPYGRRYTYAQVAQMIGSRSPRAVGAANGQNPVSLIVPCHRLVGTAGDLRGYAGGLPMKQALLDMEQAVLHGGSWGGFDAVCRQRWDQLTAVEQERLQK